MRVLVVGSGAREHALCWALRRGPRLRQLYCAPGNAGTALLAESVPIAAESVEALTAWAAAEEIDLVVVGPEVPLADGLVDALTARGVRAFGPSAAAAELEASKSWSAGFMDRHRIPAPRARVCADVAAGLVAIEELGLPVALKADGLAAGKGVILADTLEQAQQGLSWMLDERGLGVAGQQVVLQEFLEGPELSILAFSDGHNVAAMPAARDYKRIGEGNQGPNTGGMGAYCRPSFADQTLLERIRREVLEPTVQGLAAEGRPFRGVVYAGLMITSSGPRVLEFNCRFGDPEAQAILPLLESDLLDVLEAVAVGQLRPADLRWRPGAACGVVLASEGYPGPYQVGRPITGLDDLPRDGLVFQAGTDQREDAIVTAGGRVLTATGVGENLAEARRAAYSLAERISFEGCYYRRDIAADDAAVTVTP